MLKWIGFACLCLIAVPCAAQSFNLSGAAAEDPAALALSMPELARKVIAVYWEDDRRRYLDNLFRLQIVAGQYADAGKTLASLRALPAGGVSAQAGAAQVLYAIFAEARAQQSQDGSSFDAAFQRSFRETLGRLDDRTSALVMRALGVDLSAVRQNLSDALETLKGKRSIPVPDALILIRAYQDEQAFRSVSPLAPALIDEDDRRRYIIDKDVAVKTADGATVCAMVVRPRSAAVRLPALLNFTIYADPRTTLDEARRTASNGYAGVEGLTRGKGCSPDPPVPYEKDGSDAAAVIDWRRRRPGVRPAGCRATASVETTRPTAAASTTNTPEHDRGLPDDLRRRPDQHEHRAHDDHPRQRPALAGVSRRRPRSAGAAAGRCVASSARGSPPGRAMIGSITSVTAAPAPNCSCWIAFE